MSKVLTIMNMKGGVGKTTVAMHIGGVASYFGFGSKPAKKVLLIDYDPQFNLSQAFLPSRQYFELENDQKTTISILLDNAKHIDPFQLNVAGNFEPPEVEDLATRIYAYEKHWLDIIPSTLDLMFVSLGQATNSTKSIEERFNKFIKKCRSKYDLIIIDCHPAGSLFTKTSLLNSDHVLIPVMPQSYALRGVGLMLRFIEEKKIGDNGPLPHILINGVSSNGKISAEEADLRGDARFAQYCLTNTLKKAKIFSEPQGGRDFVWFSKKPHHKKHLHNLISVTGEIIRKIGA